MDVVVDAGDGLLVEHGAGRVRITELFVEVGSLAPVVPGSFGAVPAVSGVRVGVLGLPVRHSEEQHPTRLEHPVSFTHEPDRVVNVLEHLMPPHFLESVVRERPWDVVEVVHHVHAGQVDRVKVDGVVEDPAAASDVEVRLV